MDKTENRAVYNLDSPEWQWRDDKRRNDCFRWKRNGGAKWRHSVQHLARKL